MIDLSCLLLKNLIKDIQAWIYYIFTNYKWPLISYKSIVFILARKNKIKRPHKVWTKKRLWNTSSDEALAIFFSTLWNNEICPRREELTSMRIWLFQSLNILTKKPYPSFENLWWSTFRVASDLFKDENSNIMQLFVCLDCKTSIRFRI